MITISRDFPGANIVVEEMTSGTVTLRRDLRDTEGDWFYWLFRAEAAPGEEVLFRFVGGPAIGARGPAVSTDGGLSWKWLGESQEGENEFRYRFGREAVLFGMTIPYTERDLRRFLGRGLKVQEETLCESRHGRNVELLRMGAEGGEASTRVLITARHHSCETMGSFVLEGLLEFLSSDEGEMLRAKVEFLIVPFVDKDGVEEGDQGKNRRPRDHNRDYKGPALYPETAALRVTVPPWADGQLKLVLDLHCPWLRGGVNERLYLVGSAVEAIWREQLRFSEILEREQGGVLPFRVEDNIPFGTDWNVAASFSKGQSLVDWAANLPGVRCAASVEIPYAVASGVEVNAESARGFGADLGRAIAVYLQEETAR